jgi:metal-responsive CopG/Arc/MetJ family transcriptional regulator
MKTAISVPDEVFNQVGAQASELGISRSEFFSRAARRYLAELAAQSVTNQINQALDVSDADDTYELAMEAGRRVLAAEDDW